MTFRKLTISEKNLLKHESISVSKNGTVISFKCVEENSDNDITIILPSLVSQSLKKLIPEIPELFTTINDNYQFIPIDSISCNDVISIISFDNENDAIVNCHFGAPTYLIDHIYFSSMNDILPGKKTPFWKLFIVKNQIIFYGHEILFDIFKAKRIVLRLAKIIRNLFGTFDETSNNYSNQLLFDLVKRCPRYSKYYLNPTYASQIYPREIVNKSNYSLTQIFFKSIHEKEDLRKISMKKKNNDYDNLLLNLKRNRIEYNEIILNEKSKIKDFEIVTGNVTLSRYNHLLKILKNENTSLKAFMCSVIMICLKSIFIRFDSNIIFKIIVDFAKEGINSASEKQYITVEVPLALIEEHGDEEIIGKQFQVINKFINKEIQKKLKLVFLNNDIEEVLPNFENELQKNIIEINDLTDNEISDNINNLNTDSLHFEELCFTKNLKPNHLLSLLFASNDYTGLNICINHYKNYKMKDFVDCFQSFMEE